MSAELYPGCKVECIDASLTYGRSWVGDVPVKGAIYTVRDIISAHTAWDEMSLILVEIENRLRSYGGDTDWGYRAKRFRPIRRDFMCLEELKVEIAKIFGKGRVDA